MLTTMTGALLTGAKENILLDEEMRNMQTQVLGTEDQDFNSQSEKMNILEEFNENEWETKPWCMYMRTTVSTILSILYSPLL